MSVARLNMKGSHHQRPSQPDANTSSYSQPDAANFLFKSLLLLLLLMLMLLFLLLLLLFQTMVIGFLRLGLIHGRDEFVRVHALWQRHTGGPRLPRGQELEWQRPTGGPRLPRGQDLEWWWHWRSQLEWARGRCIRLF